MKAVESDNFITQKCQLLNLHQSNELQSNSLLCAFQAPDIIHLGISSFLPLTASSRISILITTVFVWHWSILKIQPNRGIYNRIFLYFERLVMYPISLVYEFYFIQCLKIVYNQTASPISFIYFLVENNNVA